MRQLLVDTSTLSDIIRPEERRSAGLTNHLKLYLAEHPELTFSELSYFDILRGLLKKSASAQIIRFEEFCSRSSLIPISRSILARAAGLWAAGRRQGIMIEDADLIIAATALDTNLAVATANPKHFQWIEGLLVTDWRTG